MKNVIIALLVSSILLLLCYVYTNVFIQGNNTTLNTTHDDDNASYIERHSDSFEEWSNIYLKVTYYFNVLDHIPIDHPDKNARSDEYYNALSLKDKGVIALADYTRISDTEGLEFWLVEHGSESELLLDYLKDIGSEEHIRIVNDLLKVFENQDLTNKQSLKIFVHDNTDNVGYNPVFRKLNNEFRNSKDDLFRMSIDNYK